MYIQIISISIYIYTVSFLFLFFFLCNWTFFSKKKNNKKQCFQCSCDSCKGYVFWITEHFFFIPCVRIEKKKTSNHEFRMFFVDQGLHPEMICVLRCRNFDFKIKSKKFFYRHRVHLVKLVYCWFLYNFNMHFVI